MNGTTNLDEARALFAQPDIEEKPKETDFPMLDDHSDDEGPDDDDEHHQKRSDRGPRKRKAMNIGAMAEKRGAKFFIYRNNRDATLLFGKHKGCKVSRLASTVEGRDYLRWMLSQDFDENLINTVRLWLARQI